ncbi:MAG TPA: Uma2 family endonuclease [Candidatus Limnocylindrales bacterium]|nr:Uma2 family endonuclease [Candidatus Limnocylindrales bacterium]
MTGLYEIGLRIGDDRVIPDLMVLPPGTPLADSDYNDVETIKPALVVEVASRSTETIDRGNKMIVYAKGGIPAYWRLTRDGVVHMHRLMEAGEYGLLATVKPGEPHDVLWPFPLTLDPAKLRSA